MSEEEEKESERACIAAAKIVGKDREREKRQSARRAEADRSDLRMEWRRPALRAEAVRPGAGLKRRRHACRRQGRFMRDPSEQVSGSGVPAARLELRPAVLLGLIGDGIQASRTPGLAAA